MPLVTKRRQWTIALLFICSLLSLSFVSQANADGGAPNLAYVSGTSSGINHPILTIPAQPDTICEITQPILRKVMLWYSQRISTKNR